MTNETEESDCSKEDLLTLNLMIFYVNLWIDVFEMAEEMNEPAFIVSNSLVGATNKEAFCVVVKMLINASVRAINNENPFDYGEPEEMIWSELYDAVLTEEKENYQDKGITVLSAYFENTDSSTHEINPFQKVKDILNDTVCFDTVAFLKGFYPHAWTEDTESYKDLNLERLLAELEFVTNNKTQDQLEKLYCSEAKEELPVKKPAVKPKVAKKQTKKPLLKFLYLMKCSTSGFYKIGVSNNVNYREKTLQYEKPTVTAIAKWEKASFFEKMWHKYFANYRIRGEWFQLSKAQVAFMCSVMNGDRSKIFDLTGNNNLEEAI